MILVGPDAMDCPANEKSLDWARTAARALSERGLQRPPTCDRGGGCLSSAARGAFRRCLLRIDEGRTSLREGSTRSSTSPRIGVPVLSQVVLLGATAVMWMFLEPQAAPDARTLCPGAGRSADDCPDPSGNWRPGAEKWGHGATSALLSSPQCGGATSASPPASIDVPDRLVTHSTSHARPGMWSWLAPMQWIAPQTKNRLIGHVPRPARSVNEACSDPQPTIAAGTASPALLVALLGVVCSVLTRDVHLCGKALPEAPLRPGSGCPCYCKWPFWVLQQ